MAAGRRATASPYQGISVANEVLRRMIPGEGLGDLSVDPIARRIGGDVDPDQVAPLKPDDHQAVEQLEADRRHDKQIYRINMRDVIAQEDLPALRWRSASANHVLSDSRLGDG